MMKKEKERRHFNFNLKMRGYWGGRQLLLPKTDHLSTFTLK